MTGLATGDTVTAPPEQVAPPVLRCVGLRKEFGATVALERADLELRPGSIHALVGENGAGKSTCLGLIAGRLTPTSGHLELDGRVVEFKDPAAALRKGVVAVYQELTIVPALTTQANIFLPGPLSRFGVLRESAMRRSARQVSETLGEIPMDVRADELSVADQQLVEISRGLMRDPRIMLFDEPTSSLGPPERDALFAVMRNLKQSGIAIALVSHNLDEVLQIADTVTVFRDGRLVRSGPISRWTKVSLTEAMLGDKAVHVLAPAALGQAAPASEGAQTRRLSAGERQDVLRVEGLSVPGVVEDVDLTLADGEIVGLGGLVGSGRSTVLRALGGLEPSASGRLWIDGKQVRWPRSPRAALRLGIALIPEDRKKQGLFLGLTAAENIVISDLGRASRAGVVSPARLRDVAESSSQAFGIASGRLTSLAGELSGGNQQKLLLARWKHRLPRVLLADEPTRGVDIGAKAEILRSLRELSGHGLAIVMVSSEFEEIVSLCQRVAVISQGRLVTTLEGEQMKTEAILKAAFGVEAAPEAGS